MLKDERIVSYTASELEEMVRQGERKSDWARVDALTDEEIEASIDHEDEGTFDWSTVTVERPQPKVPFTMRYDPEILEWFREQGPGYQTRINAVLRSYIEAQRDCQAS
jgi:uncharacterized protein (DUF4415 family)